MKAKTYTQLSIDYLQDQGVEVVPESKTRYQIKDPSGFFPQNGTSYTAPDVRIQARRKMVHNVLASLSASSSVWTSDHWSTSMNNAQGFVVDLPHLLGRHGANTRHILERPGFLRPHLMPCLRFAPLLLEVGVPGPQLTWDGTNGWECQTSIVWTKHSGISLDARRGTLVYRMLGENFATLLHQYNSHTRRSELVQELPSLVTVERLNRLMIFS